VRYEQSTCSKIGLGYVRTLAQREELPLLRDPLLRLDTEELAKLAVTAPFVAARTVKNLNGAYWMLLFSAWLLYPPQEVKDSSLASTPVRCSACFHH
jgi:hypothetical protein